MAVLFYQPRGGDPERTSVANGRLVFAAYQPTAIDTSNPIDLQLFEKLKANPFFGETIDADRQQRWQKWRNVGDKP